MANNEKNYKNFLWNDQTINEKMVKSVSVRIFRPLEEVTATAYHQLVDTDGKKRCKSSKTHISDYTYVLLSTGICEKSLISSCHSFYLHIKLYITDNFSKSSLNDVEFVGKQFLLEALEQFESSCLDLTLHSKPDPDLFNYFKKKLGDEATEFHLLLQESAQAERFNLIEKLFKNYGISAKYQALFWKELYRKEKKK